MDLEETVKQLSAIEKKALRVLSPEKAKNSREISQESKLHIDSVRRAIAWLHEKQLIELKEKKEQSMRLTQTGKSSLKNGLPEKIFIEKLQLLGGKGSFEELKKESELNAAELNAAIGIAKKNAWIAIRKHGKTVQLELTGLEKDLLQGKFPLEIVLKKISEKEKISGEEEKALNELIKRNLAEKTIVRKREATLSALGKKALPLLGKVKSRAYNVKGTVPEIFIGKKQPYVRFLQATRRRLTELGFIEMDSPLIVQEFYNFDALFQPQNHPARQWTDTYQLKQPSFGKLPEKKIVAQVKAAHENGWKTGSKGWGYKWSTEIAKRLMPAAHCTAHSARQLVKGVTIPGKYFAISRCYRPDIVDASHLIEFSQLDGIIIDEKMDFRKLLGTLKQFAIEFGGTDKVKFAPSYFPFTEPSCELQVKHQELGWMEIGGSGICRPELTLPLGIKQPVLAWGIGIDRLAMIKLGIKDIRQLFSDDLDWLRQSRVVQ